MSLRKKELKYIESIGKGTYGSVHSAIDNEGNEIAVKINKTDITTTGVGTLKEMDILARLKGHPFIVELKTVYFIEPFRYRKSTPHRDGMKQDIMSFVLDRADIDGYNFFKNKSLCTPTVAIKLAAELLLALEYIHAKGIMHRDISASNMLINKVNEKYTLKISDLGMSQNYCKSVTQTPGVTTCYYRAVEICGGIDYCLSCDIWSAACVIFEMFGMSSFITHKEDEDLLIFDEILSKLPEMPSPQKMMLYSGLNKHRSERMRAKDLTIKRKRFVERLNNFDNLNNCNIVDLDALEDLFRRMFDIDPHSRLSAGECLDHRFFSPVRSYITSIRKHYRAQPEELEYIYIRQCVERKWVFEIVSNINENLDYYRWAYSRLLFHAIDLFDRYVKWAFDNPDKTPIDEEETENKGRLHGYFDTAFRFYICMYLIHKYNSTLRVIEQWRDFAPKEYTTKEAISIVKEFEEFLIINVCCYYIYRPTLFEIGNDESIRVEPTEDIVKKLLKGYENVEWNTGGSVRKLYKHLMKN